MNKTHMYKIFINTTIVLSLIIAILFTTSASASHTYSEQYGSTTNFYGHFGQPTGSVLSGSYTFIASATKNTDRISFIVTDPTVKTRFLDQVPASSVQRGSGEDYYSIEIDTTELPNGDYLLFGTIECDDCTPNGIRDSVYHQIGDPHIKFTVDNPPVVENNPVVQYPPQEDFCSSRLDDALSLGATILSKHKATLSFTDKFSSQAASFYEKQDVQITRFEDMLDSSSELRKVASDQLVLLKVKADFNCDSSLQSQVEEFIKASSKYRDSTDTYKDSVIDSILVLLEEL